MRLNELQDAMNNVGTDSDIFELAKEYACNYLQTLNERSVYPDNEAVENLISFSESLPEAPCEPTEMLELLHTKGGPATTAQAGGRYFGFVNGSIFPPALAAKWLSDTWDQNPALYVISPVTAHLETLCERWIVDLLGLPKGTAAGFVSGTSVATLCGLITGRDTLLSKLGWDAQAYGLFGAPELKVVVGQHTHATVMKALSLAGLGRDRVVKVPVDQQGCIIAESLPELDNSTLVVLQAGNVNSGGFDPFTALCQAANAAGAWVHIDGAFGLWAAATEQTRHLTQGIELADSWSVDGHKTLNTPYDCGIILCKKRDALISSMQASGSYIAYSDKRDGMLYTPEMSRRSRAIELWATLKCLGKQGVEALISGLCDHAKLFAKKLAAQNFRILNRVDFNQVLLACDTPELTQRTLALIQQSGICWCGGSVWFDEPVIRISVCSWRTTVADVEKTVATFVACRDQADAG